MSFLERLLEDPVRFARLKRWSCIVLVVIALGELVMQLLVPGHPHFAFERFPAWGSLYGLISCAAIIVGSKFIGKLFLMRSEDHHDS